MAFGFGFNKQKTLNSAEKFVQQGKLQNAISEYEKVLKSDPKDLTVMNTVGDLNARLGNTDKAVECFKSVGDTYASQGFTVKAIAMYKKLSKLRSSTESVLRLAELYTQQGLFNDARAQYLQVAEEFLKAGQAEQAIRIFQKTLEMDPENVPMRTKLAEVYVRLGKKTEAWQLFAAAAETLRAKGQLSATEELLQRMLTLDPGNSYALLLRGRTAFDSGEFTTCIENLERVADLDSHPDGLRILMQAYAQTGRLSDAAPLAAKLLSVHNDAGSLATYADALVSAGQFEEALRVYQEHSDRLLAMDQAKVLETLHSIIGHVRENTAALEMVLGLLTKAGDTTHVNEVYELLAHASVQAGEFEKARDYYHKLTQLEPDNQVHAQNYQQVLTKIGAPSAGKLITVEEGAMLVDEMEATAPFVDQRYDDNVALALRAALTDAELFISYNMPAKALAPLTTVLPQAPRDLRVNQRLAALHTRAGRFAEAAICCRSLESVYHDAGHPEEAKRYGELAAKYEERAAAAVPSPLVSPRKEMSPVTVDAVKAPEAAAPAETAAPEAAVDEAPIAEVASPAPAAPFFHVATPAPADFQVKAGPPAGDEIDLSQEWEGELSVEDVTATPSPAAIAKTAADPEAISSAVDEVKFYISQGMLEEAHAACEKLVELGADAAAINVLRDEVKQAVHGAPAAQPAVEEVSVEELEVPPASTEIPAEVAHQDVPAPAAEAKPRVLESFVADLETSLGDRFLGKPAASTPAPAVHEIAPPEAQNVPTPPAAAKHAAGALGDFVTDLEASLGDSFSSAAPGPQSAVPVQASPSPKEVVTASSAETPAAEAAAPPIAMAAAAGAMSPTAAASGMPFVHIPQPPIVPPAAPPPAASKSFDTSELAAGVDLAGMFGDLKQELEEGAAATAEEDPETHYNLGVAFREMGLLDEAISELQKVCQSVEHGRAFPQIMQAYTWLAQCFLDKGIPEAAIRWYEKALKIPTIDGETRTALHYELASSYETAGDKPSALNHFLEVYGSNIDYRDVGERIKSLRT